MIFFSFRLENFEVHFQRGQEKIYFGSLETFFLKSQKFEAAKKSSSCESHDVIEHQKLAL